MRVLEKLWIKLGSFFLRILPGGSYTADRTLTLTLGDGDRTLDLSGGTDFARLSAANHYTAMQTFDTAIATVFGVIDTGGDHVLIIDSGENLVSDRTLTVIVNDSNRTLTLSGNATISDWFDQSVKVAASPQFATIELGNASDTTLARSSAGNVSIEGNVVYRAGGTDVAVADGGTGVSTLAAHGVVLGNGTSAVLVTGTGTSGQVLTSGGASADPAFADPITASSSSVTITSGHTITSSSGTYEDVTGLTLNLPSAGKYKIIANLRGQVTFSAGSNGFITARLDLNGSTVTDSERLVVIEPATNVTRINTIAMDVNITAAGAHTIKVQAKRDGTGITWTSASIAADGNGKSSLSYTKIGN